IQNKPAVYHLYTVERIIQNNALKIARPQEYHLLKDANRTYNYPLSVSLLEPLPEKQIRYKVLTNTAGDSVGVVYAVPGHFEQLMQTWQKANNTWHSIFAIFCFVAFLIFVTFWIDLELLWLNMIIRIFFVFCGWSV